MRVRFEIADAFGDVVSISGNEFRVLQAGTDEATLDNAHQELPWRVSLRLNRVSRQMQFTVTLVLRGAVAVARLLQRLRLQNALAKAGTLRLFNEDTGLQFADVPFSRVMEAVPDSLVTFAESALTIQTATHTPLFLHEGDVPRDEFETVRTLRAAIETGRISGRPSPLKATLTRAGAEFLLADRPGRPLNLTILKSETWDVLGAPVEVGRVMTEVRGLGLDQETFQRIRAEFDAGHETVSVEFRPVGDMAHADRYFLSWLPSEEVQSLQKRFPAIDSIE
jgi:hypothetical protein